MHPPPARQPVSFVLRTWAVKIHKAVAKSVGDGGRQAGGEVVEEAAGSQPLPPAAQAFSPPSFPCVLRNYILKDGQ